MKINCIIIDDEPLARKGLHEYIDEIDFLEYAAEFDTPLTATGILSAGKVDPMFLDIEMPKLSGLDFLKSLPAAPPVIFTTAYPQFALEGFECNALDYLVKPIAFDRFFKAALKAKEYYEIRQKNLQANSSSNTEDYFFIKADGKLLKIFFKDVLFIEALQNYVTIHTSTKKYITYLTFKSVEDSLPQHQFIKTHKSYIVAKEKIDTIEGNTIKIANNTIPISRSLREEVMLKVLGKTYLKR